MVLSLWHSPSLLRFPFRQFRHFYVLRPTLGTILRVTTDMGSTWIAFLFSWLVVEGSDFTALLNPRSRWIVGFLSLFSILAFVAYTGAGLYTGAGGYALSVKIQRIIWINISSLIIACGVLWLHESSTVSIVYLFVATFAGSAALLCLSLCLGRTEHGQVE
jgi:hypothetical protein